MAELRNTLVYDYLKIDREIVYEIILDNLKDIEKFIKVIVEYI
ncbi:HepT-like ribonuclease domain-containing protein [Clostridium sp. JNZ J1-5]